MQISIFTKFCNDVYIIFRHENINGMKDIFMTNSTQRSDLVIQKVFLDFILDFGEFNDLKITILKENDKHFCLVLLNNTS